MDERQIAMLEGQELRIINCVKLTFQVFKDRYPVVGEISAGINQNKIHFQLRVGQGFFNLWLALLKERIEPV